MPINPTTPFVWPEPRVRGGENNYDQNPPITQLALDASSLFGVIPAITTAGVFVLETWLERNPDLHASLIVPVYPACSTRSADLSALLAISEQLPDRLAVHILPLEFVTDRALGAICFLTRDSDTVHIVAGSSENLGLTAEGNGQLNFAFRAEPALVEAFKRHFDWLWANSGKLTSRRATAIPELVLPNGSEEAARMWEVYATDLLAAPATDDEPLIVAEVNQETGEVDLKSPDGTPLLAPTDRLGIKKLDLLADYVARLYEKGALVTLDKFSRIPPLDAPLDPRLFGDTAELHRGSVSRKVSMRVSVIDEKTLKEIESRRQGLRTVLNKFSFGLADNLRWMPLAARPLFEAEVTRINEDGQRLISDLLKGDVDAFLRGRHDALVSDLNGMFVQLGRPGEVTADLLAKVVTNLKDRLSKAQTGNFTPTLTYSSISFRSGESDMVSPWGPVYSLLSEIATFPRKAHTDGFFFRGVKCTKKDLLKAMNVADDALFRNIATFDLEEHCKADLEILSQIEKASLESRARCEFVWQLISGVPRKAIEKELKGSL